MRELQSGGVGLRSQAGGLAEGSEVASATTLKAVAAAAIDIDCKALTENTLRIKDIHKMGEDNTMAHPKRDEGDSIGGR